MPKVWKMVQITGTVTKYWPDAKRLIEDVFKINQDEYGALAFISEKDLIWFAILSHESTARVLET